MNVNASGPREYWASVRTGADGRFELTGAPAGTITLRATAGDFLSGSTRSANGSVAIAEGQKEAEAEIVFEGTGALSGRVTRGGSPVADARVFAGRRPGRLVGLGADRRERLLPDRGAHARRLHRERPGARQVEAGRSRRRSGSTARPRSTSSSRWRASSASSSTARRSSRSPTPASRRTSTAAPSGRPGFATSDSNGRFFVDDVEPGAYTLTLRRSGYQEASDKASATDEGGDAGTIEMTRGEGLELQVRDGIYQIPLRSANVRVKDGAGATVTSTWLSLDGDGKGEIASLRPGRYTLVLGSNGYATQVLEGVVVPGAPLPVVLTPGGSVEIRPGEASRAKGTATLRSALGQPHPYRSWGNEGRVNLPAAGNEVVENLAPGSYTLAVEGVAPKGFTVTEGGRTVVELP